MTVRTLRSEAAPKYRLRFLLQEFNLPFGITIIGRADDCQVTLFDPSVSRQHARIIVDDRCAIIEDLKSRNGVWLNGTRVYQAVLQQGDALRLGATDLIYEILFSA